MNEGETPSWLAYTGLGATAVLFLGAGVALGWAIWGYHAPTPGGPAPQQVQPDGSLVLERRPAENVAPAPHQLPSHGVEERRVAVTVRAAQDVPKGGMFHVELSLARLPDGSSRVVASSPDGTVVGGLDVPVTSVLVAEERRPWSAGVSYAWQEAYGVFVHRDIWRVRLGLEVNSNRDRGSEARVLIGWCW